MTGCGHKYHPNLRYAPDQKIAFTNWAVAPSPFGRMWEI